MIFEPEKVARICPDFDPTGNYYVLASDYDLLLAQLDRAKEVLIETRDHLYIRQDIDRVREMAAAVLDAITV